MGATQWTYTVPYQPDINKALEELRQEVFAKGEYYKPWEELREFREKLEAKPKDQLTDHERDTLAFLQTMPPLEPPDPLPATIEELLEQNGESGTHSILDIFGISETGECFKAAPVPPDVLTATFGTTRPTREQLESCEESEPWQEFLAYLDRWEAFYFVVYAEGQPHEIVFEGCSGD
jgi:hypothetical protein